MRYSKQNGTVFRIGLTLEHPAGSLLRFSNRKWVPCALLEICEYQGHPSVKINYSINFRENNYVMSCNQDCSCSLEKTNHMCGDDHVLFPSPCHAGCDTGFQNRVRIHSHPITLGVHQIKNFGAFSSLPKFKIFHESLLAFVGVCLVIISEWPALSHKLWFLWIVLSDGSAKPASYQ